MLVFFANVYDKNFINLWVQNNDDNLIIVDSIFFILDFSINKLRNKIEVLRN